MTSSSPSSRGKGKVVRITRNADTSGWISDEEIREVFLRWKRIKTVVPHKYLELDLFRKEGFHFQEWIETQGLTMLVQMKGDCYPNLVEVAGLKADGLHSHVRNLETNMWLKKRDVYRNWLRFPGRYTIERLYVHDGLNKEEKMTVYILTWLILPGRILRDRMTTEDVFLLCAIKNDIPTNWVEVLKDHMIEGGINQARTLPYGVLISKILVLQGVDVSGEKKLLCDKSNEINRITLTFIGLVKNMNGWCFKDEENMAASSGSSPVLNEDQTSFIPGTNFERFVAEQFRKTSERILKLGKKVDVLYQKEIKNDLEKEDFGDESTDEDSMDTSRSE
ncbi:hypothetical protein LR48_Vigan08g104300 [Vigna angularis]|uniref:Uncharacterized protein n=1 Tax=Phaseolus angularis TaxID=3914 RepID=A0A0L9V5B8_PHAAN|nr:hypothetical protein LR48_Vigan08g104300 [Vigna angularis]